MRLKRPREPTAGECCGSGCARCVWDVYYDNLSAYEEERARLKEAGELSDSDDTDFDESEESSSSSGSTDELTDYIGTVVVKMLASTPDPVEVTRVITDALDKGSFCPIHQIKLRQCSESDCSVDGKEPICVLDLEVPKLPVAPCPGDIVEVLAPNNALQDEDLVRSVCERLQVDPEATCELHRSPFVPEDHFPPWLPLRQAMTVRSLLTHYVDLTSCSYLLRPVFFQSLLRIYDNKNRGGGGSGAPTGVSELKDEGVGSVELLRACAEETTAPAVFRHILNKGKPLCYPCLADVLDVFPFVRLPLDRLLEISGPLQPRKFSVAGYSEGESSSQLDTVQLCIRQVTKLRNQNTFPTAVTPTEKTSRELVGLLNSAAERRHEKGEAPSLWFHGHTSMPLVRLASSSGSSRSLEPTPLRPTTQLYLGTSQFGSSTFASELRRALVSLCHTPHRCGPLILIGAGTGIAPLIAAVKELCHRRQSCANPTIPFPCWTIYGGRCMRELVYHDTLSEAQRTGAISRYTYALSRETRTPTPQKHVIDVMGAHADDIRDGLVSGGAQLFVCGPTPVLRSVRQFLGTTLLGEADDDDSVREQRLILLEEKQQLFFDVWSTVNIFE